MFEFYSDDDGMEFTSSLPGSLDAIDSALEDNQAFMEMLQQDPAETSEHRIEPFTDEDCPHPRYRNTSGVADSAPQFSTIPIDSPLLNGD